MSEPESKPGPGRLANYVEPAERMGPHDMGGDLDADLDVLKTGEVTGPIDTTDHGMSHWERQANGLRMSCTRAKVVRLDELRRAAEGLGEDYYRLPYFERTTTAMRNLLLEKRVITRDELEAKMAEIRSRFADPAT